MTTKTIILAQLNPTVGDIEGNAALLREVIAGAQDADLIIAPELVISGYPPEDMVMRPAYIAACMDAVRAVAKETAGGPGLVLTTPWTDEMTGIDRTDGRPYNACLLLGDGEILAVRRKQCLPNYSVFDEPRTFRPGDGSDGGPVTFRGLRLGLITCEDMWYPEPAAKLAGEGIDLLIAPHGSPFRLGAEALRQKEALDRARETGVPVLFVNQVGGQDELVFDGGAFIAEPDGQVHQAARFTEGAIETRWQSGPDGCHLVSPLDTPTPDDNALLYEALMLGTRDYVHKSGFSKVVLGLSGGIDSAMVATVAADALGPDNVRAVMMPSPYTSDHSLVDAEACAQALGISYEIISIEPAMAAFQEMLAPAFTGLQEDVTEENIQSRIRGSLLMALSNKFGSLLLSTGNKSEMAVGYATLYGDMNGAYNPLKDVYKTRVFALARWRNQHQMGQGPDGEMIPQRIITKPPSAELREGQKDEDSLPPYDTLDAMLEALVEREEGVSDLITKGFDRDDALRIQRLVYNAEYKRRQSPPGPKVTTRNFGRDRRYPIVNRWRDRT